MIPKSNSISKIREATAPSCFHHHQQQQLSSSSYSTDEFGLITSTTTINDKSLFFLRAECLSVTDWIRFVDTSYENR
jgi:hypothetical protein